MCFKLAKAEMFFSIPRCSAKCLIAFTTCTPFMLEGTAQFYTYKKTTLKTNIKYNHLTRYLNVPKDVDRDLLLHFVVLEADFLGLLDNQCKITV